MTDVIAGVTFDDYQKKMESEFKKLDRNRKNGSKLKTASQIEKARSKYAWTYSEQRNQSMADSYNRNRSSFDNAYNQITSEIRDLVKRRCDLSFEDVELEGSISWGEEEKDFVGKILSKEDIEKYVDQYGVCGFNVKNKDTGKKIQGWCKIYTMACLHEEENQLKSMFQKQAQEEANRTGEKAVVQNLVGWIFEAEPE